MVKGAMTRMGVHSTGVVPAEVVWSGIEATIPSLNLTDIFLWLFSIHTMIAIKAMAMMANNKKYSKGLCSCDIIFIPEKVEKIVAPYPANIKTLTPCPIPLLVIISAIHIMTKVPAERV